MMFMLFTMMHIDVMELMVAQLLLAAMVLL